MRRSVKKLIAVIMTFACVAAMSCVPTFADANNVLVGLVQDFRVVNYSVGGYEVIADPWIMTKRNRQFKNNEDFMIILKKSGEIYTGSEVKIKIVEEDDETVSVKIVKIKGVPDSRRLFKNSDEIDFYKNITDDYLEEHETEEDEEAPEDDPEEEPEEDPDEDPDEPTEEAPDDEPVEEDPGKDKPGKKPEKYYPPLELPDKDYPEGYDDITESSNMLRSF